MRIVLFLLMLVPSPVAALEICDDLWFTRNLIFHRVDYCFGSALGRSVFDNTVCTTKSPVLSRADSALVAKIRSLEVEWECRLDTSRRRLNVPDLDFRKSLYDLPVATGYESGCIGWRGEPFKLRSARHPVAPETATGWPGDNLLYQFESVGDWEYVGLYRNGGPAGAGWVRMPLEHVTCDNYAG